MNFDLLLRTVAALITFVQDTDEAITPDEVFVMTTCAFGDPRTNVVVEYGRFVDDVLYAVIPGVLALLS